MTGPGDDTSDGETGDGGWSDEGGWFSDDSSDDSGEGYAHF